MILYLLQAREFGKVQGWPANGRKDNLRRSSQREKLRPVPIAEVLGILVATWLTAICPNVILRLASYFVIFEVLCHEQVQAMGYRMALFV